MRDLIYEEVINHVTGVLEKLEEHLRRTNGLGPSEEITVVSVKRYKGDLVVRIRARDKD